MLKELEKMEKGVKNNIKMDHDILKSYEDLKQVHRESSLGDHVYLKVKPKKSSMWFEICAKLSSKLCGPFQVLAQTCSIAYELASPSNINVHNVFHVSLLNKYIHDPTHIIYWNAI